jgi:capsular polysaccharide biosynthesis protein
LISDPNISNYYHFLIDVIPRLIFIRTKMPDKKILIPSFCISIPFIIPALKYFNLLDDHLIFVSDAFSCEDFILLYNLPYLDRTQLIKSRISTRLQSIEFLHNYSERLMVFSVREHAVSRQGVLSPTLVNNLFQKFNFKFCDFGMMNFEAQVDIAANSCVIAGLHGAGLANSVFMESTNQSIVIDLMPIDHLAFEICAVCVANGIRYQRLLVKPDSHGRYKLASDQPFHHELMSSVVKGLS